MTEDNDSITPTDLVDGTHAGLPPESVPVEFAAEEVEIARRVRAVMGDLRAASIEVPAGFEERLLARVREDETVLDVLELGLSGFGRAIVELLNALLSFLPAAAEPPQPAIA